MEQMSAARRRTDRVIRECFLGLLEQKPIQKITVQDLCEAAEINRATFYRYYEDIYALYDAVTQSFFDALFTDIVRRQQSGNNQISRLQQGVRDALDLIEAKKSLCYLLFHDVDSLFTYKLLREIQAAVSSEADQKDALTRLRVSYMCGGILTVIMEWIRDGCRAEKEAIAQVIETGVLQTLHQ